MSSAINDGASFGIKSKQTKHYHVTIDDGDWEGVGVIAARALTPGAPLEVKNLSVELEIDSTYKWWFTVTNHGPSDAIFQIFAGTG